MARLHEHQGKALLREHGVAVPRGFVVRSPEEARRACADLGGRAVVKMQAFTTSRKAQGGVALVDSPEDAQREAARMLQMRVGAYPVEELLVEEQLPIRRELFVSLTVDDAARAPVLLLSLAGGSGVEERAQAVLRVPAHVERGVDERALGRALAESDLDEAVAAQLRDVVGRLFALARSVEARSVEINPLALLENGRLVALDCRLAVDDYAVFRHPELGVEIAREFDHPPTELEKIAHRVEQADHRGTFYFTQLPREEGRPVVGFHGAGGGGSMMSMDALTAEGFCPANFTDTSGNPSSAKVYAAARVILAQEGLVGYFGSGSGVASQEQHHSAYGLAKAFCELSLRIPAVVRLGGNNEEKAVEILERACAQLPAPVEGYTKDDSPAFIARRFRELVEAHGAQPWSPRPRTVPAFVGQASALRAPVRFGKGWEGTAWVDPSCPPRARPQLVERSGGLLRLDERGELALAVSPEASLERDSDWIALEIDARIEGLPHVFVDIPIAGLDDGAG